MSLLRKVHQKSRTMTMSSPHSIKGSDPRPQGVQRKLENAVKVQTLRPLSRGHILPVKLKTSIMATCALIAVSLCQAHGAAEDTFSIRKLRYNHSPRNTTPWYMNASGRTYSLDETEMMVCTTKNNLCAMHVARWLVRVLCEKLEGPLPIRATFENAKEILQKKLYEFENEDATLAANELTHQRKEVMFEVLNDYGITVQGMEADVSYLPEHEQFINKVVGFPTRDGEDFNKQTSDMCQKFIEDVRSNPHDPDYPAYIFYTLNHWYCLIFDKAQGSWSLYDNAYNPTDFTYGQVLDSTPLPEGFNDLEAFFMDEVHRTRDGRRYRRRAGTDVDGQDTIEYDLATKIYRIPRLEEQLVRAKTALDSHKSDDEKAPEPAVNCDRPWKPIRKGDSVYYWNRKTDKVTWEKPADCLIDHEYIPPKETYSRSSSQKGNVAQKSSVVEPTTQPEVAPQEPSSRPWKPIPHGEENTCYYWNIDTDETTWDRPDEETIDDKYTVPSSH